MNSLTKYEDILISVIKEAQKHNVEFVEARFHSTWNLVAILNNGKSEPSISSETQGIGIRIIYDGVMIFASINSYDSIPQLIEKLISTAKSSKKLSKNSIKLSSEKSINKTWAAEEKENLNNVNIDEMISELNNIDEYVKSFSSDVSFPKRTLILSNSIEEKFYINSEGSRILSRVPRVEFHSYLAAKTNGSLSAISIPAGYAGLGGTGGWETIKTFNFDSYIPEQLKNSSKSITSKLVKFDNNVDVIVGPEIAGIVAHESCGHPFEADRILGREAAQAGESYLDFDSVEKKFNFGIIEEIDKSEAFVSDDPTLPGSMGFYLFDDEGVEAHKRTLLQGGIVTDLLHNRETSFQKDIQSNASSRSVDYDREPIIRMSNTFIEPGDYDFEELVEDIKYGIYIKNFMEWNINDTREHQKYVGLEAYLIKNGIKDVNVKSPVLELTAKKFWSSIDGRSKTLKFSSATCGKGEPMQGAPVWTGGPHVRLRNLRVGNHS